MSNERMWIGEWQFESTYDRRTRSCRRKPFKPKSNFQKYCQRKTSAEWCSWDQSFEAASIGMPISMVPRFIKLPEEQRGNYWREKIPPKPLERRWLMMSVLTLSEWYINRLTRLRIGRGSLLSAHNMVNEGSNQFPAMLFSLNNELIADHK